jgi:hypothetical protein
LVRDAAQKEIMKGRIATPMTKPTIEKTPTPDPVALLKEELADYEKQRIEAQQNASLWQQKALLADGAHQACTAVLKKLTVQADTPQDPK